MWHHNQPLHCQPVLALENLGVSAGSPAGTRTDGCTNVGRTGRRLRCSAGLNMDFKFVEFLLLRSKRGSMSCCCFNKFIVAIIYICFTRLATPVHTQSPASPVCRRQVKHRTYVTKVLSCKAALHCSPNYVHYSTLRCKQTSAVGRRKCRRPFVLLPARHHLPRNVDILWPNYPNQRPSLSLLFSVYVEQSLTQLGLSRYSRATISSLESLLFLLSTGLYCTVASA